MKQETDIIALVAFAARLWMQNVELGGSSSGFPEAIRLQDSKGGQIGYLKNYCHNSSGIHDSSNRPRYSSRPGFGAR